MVLFHLQFSKKHGESYFSRDLLRVASCSMLHLLQTKKGPGIQQLDEPRDCLREASEPQVWRLKSQGKKQLVKSLCWTHAQNPTHQPTSVAMFPCSSSKQLDLRQRQTAGYFNQHMICYPFIIMIDQAETTLNEGTPKYRLRWPCRFSCFKGGWKLWLNSQLHIQGNENGGIQHLKMQCKRC